MDDTSASSERQSRNRFLAPFLAPHKEDRSTFEANLRGRFSAEAASEEGSVEYMDRVLDRQINKAAGLLTFDGLLFTAFSIARPQSSLASLAVAIGGFFALLAAVPLVSLLIVSVGRVSDYESAESDFKSKCCYFYFRTNMIALSAILSAISMVPAIVSTFLAILTSNILT